MSNNEKYPLEQLRERLELEEIEFYRALNISFPAIGWNLQSKRSVNSNLLERIFDIWRIDADQILCPGIEVYDVRPEYLALFTDQHAHVKSGICRIAEELFTIAELDEMLQTPVGRKELPGTPGIRFKAARESAGWSIRKTSAEFRLGRRTVDEIEADERAIPECVLRAAWEHWRVLPGNIVHGFHRAAVDDPTDARIWQVAGALPEPLQRTLLGVIQVTHAYSAEVDEIVAHAALGATII